MSATPSSIPAHVPANLVFEFDLYHLPGAEQDFHLALKRLHEQGCPDIFWSPCNGGHWVIARGEDILKIQADFEHFSNANLTVPRSARPPIPLYPIFADPPEHTAYRALINPGFSPKAVAELEARARALAIRLVEQLKPRGQLRLRARFCAAPADRSIHVDRRCAGRRPQGSARMGRWHGAPEAHGRCASDDPEDLQLCQI